LGKGVWVLTYGKKTLSNKKKEKKGRKIMGGWEELLKGRSSQLWPLKGE